MKEENRPSKDGRYDKKNCSARIHSGEKSRPSEDGRYKK